VTGEGPPIVFVHGALVNANLWRKVVPRLDGFRRVTLDLPLGSHLEPLPKNAEVSAPALGDLMADALEALDLHDATVVGNTPAARSPRSWPRAAQSESAPSY
jgi:pimeloyl-ACP methyl ester carboxylesterase